jgi:hypothetical protein
MLLYLDPDPRIPLDSGAESDPDLAPALFFRGFKMLTKNKFFSFFLLITHQMYIPLL